VCGSVGCNLLLVCYAASSVRPLPHQALAVFVYWDWRVGARGQLLMSPPPLPRAHPTRCLLAGTAVSLKTSTGGGSWAAAAGCGNHLGASNGRQGPAAALTGAVYCTPSEMPWSASGGGTMHSQLLYSPWVGSGDLQGRF
jgi:hypothetical protein